MTFGLRRFPLGVRTPAGVPLQAYCVWPAASHMLPVAASRHLSVYSAVVSRRRCLLWAGTGSFAKRDLSLCVAVSRQYCTAPQAADSDRKKGAGQLRVVRRRGVLYDGTGAVASEFQWVDIRDSKTRPPGDTPLACEYGPSADELSEYKVMLTNELKDLGVHKTLIKRTRNKEQLPQLLFAEGCLCLILRCATDHITDAMDTIGEMTNRLTIYIFRNTVVTVHRVPLGFIEDLHDEWDEHYTMTRLLNRLVNDAGFTFRQAILKTVHHFDECERELFASADKGRDFPQWLSRDIYHIKRRSAVFHRVLAMTQDTFTQLAVAKTIPSTDVFYQDVSLNLKHVRSLAEELHVSADSLLQLQYQMSSHRLNELMRVLTLFSAFFIPLSFIAGVWGMNFPGLPGTDMQDGHIYCAMLMAAVVVAIGTWFWVKGFVRQATLPTFAKTAQKATGALLGNGKGSSAAAKTPPARW